jgi:cytochrome c
MNFKSNKIRVSTAGVLLILVAACSERASENTVVATTPPEIENAVVAVVEDPEMKLGKRVFASCASCHTINAGGASTIGPNLSGVMGTAAGSKSDFVYSEALSSSKIVWTEAALHDYIESPATYLPGGTMAFVGVAAEADRKAVLTYLIAKTSNENADPSLVSDQGDDVAAWE